VIRPADGPETAEAWRAAVRRTDGPTALVLSRQELPVIDRDRYAPADGLHRGAYVLAEASGGEPELILLATGSEVWLALAARDELEQRQEIPTRVVSMPCWELFEAQDQSYRDQLLPPLVTARLAVEAGSTALWHKWVGTLGGVIGIDQFGASAPGGTALIKFGFTEDNVVERALAVLHREHVEKARMLRNLSA
jgi:transketolase